MIDAVQLPVPDQETKPFWDGLKEGKLLIQHCQSCGRWQHYPRALCVHCHSEALAFEPVKGTGTVYTYTIVRRSGNPFWQDKVPFVLAMIDLDEGVRLMSNVVDTTFDRVRIGAPVEVVFSPLGGDVVVPRFRVQEESSGE